MGPKIKHFKYRKMCDRVQLDGNPCGGVGVQTKNNKKYYLS